MSRDFFGGFLNQGVQPMVNQVRRTSRLAFGLTFLRGESVISLQPMNEETVGWSVAHSKRIHALCFLVLAKYENGELTPRNYDAKMAALARDVRAIAAVVWPAYEFIIVVREAQP